MTKPRDWNRIINRLNDTPSGAMRIRMGSPGSAQVTRCRLLEEWSNLDVTTTGAVIYLRIQGA